MKALLEMVAFRLNMGSVTSAKFVPRLRHIALCQVPSWATIFDSWDLKRIREFKAEGLIMDVTTKEGDQIALE